jgi:predicted nucleic acid-binding protein
VAGELILDTGPFVALVDRSESRHRDCVRTLESWTGSIVTTEAVLTETLYLVGPGWRPQRACLDFILRGAVTLVPPSLESLRRASALMEKYADRPMDYADATLVVLAEDLDTDQVFTLDRQDFSIYRLHGTRPFQVLP